MSEAEIIITGDGSHTLRVAALDEHYHSTFGALAESRHIFIEAGLEFILERKPIEINILEVGFGTGLNALLTMLKANNSACKYNYTAIEKYPLAKSVWNKLNYPELAEDPEAINYFNALHNCPWDENHTLTENFSIRKIEVDLRKYCDASASFDLIYFDAFGPDVQPKLWTEEVFNKIAQMTASGGVLVTYSCKGDVKRALKSAGFSIEKIPGPKGKREMLRSFKF